MSKLILDMVLNGGRVTRFHTRVTLKPESVAEHSFIVAWIATILMGGKPRAELLLACLAHDLPEHELGDVPSHTKKRIPGLRDSFRQEEAIMFAAAGMEDYEAALTPLEAEVLSFSDNFAGYLKCLYEVRMGNQLLLDVADRYMEYILQTVGNSVHLPKEDYARVIDIVSTATGESS